VTFSEGLPHQVPFRLVSGVKLVGDATVEAVYLASSGDALYRNAPSEAAVVEAMAQAGGILSFRGSAVPGFLSGIDEVEFSSPLEVGDRLDLRVKLVASFGRIFRFEGTAERDGVQVARARFYLAGGDEVTETGE
jgi:predicted hotdog family 3-hydroxylacyl-ACP dehydratase